MDSTIFDFQEQLVVETYAIKLTQFETTGSLILFLFIREICVFLFSAVLQLS